MKRKFLIAVATLFIFCFNASAQKGYLINFLCCYDNDSVSIKSQNQVLFTNRLSTEFSTGIASLPIFIDGENKKIIDVIFYDKKKVLKIKLKRITNNIKYVYIYNDKNNLYYRVYNEPLKLE